MKTEIRQLSELCYKIKSGGTPRSDNPAFYGGNIPFVTIEDMTTTSHFIEKTRKTITELGLKNSNCWIVPKGSLLYSIYATLGIPRITRIEVATNQAILGLIPNPKEIDTDYLYYSLVFLENYIHKLSAQTTQSNLSALIVRNFRIPVFDQKAQKAIAQVLATVDRAIEQTEALIAKYQRIKSGLMQDLLTRGIDENGQLRDPATHRFKESPLGMIPEEWEYLTANDLCDEICVGIVIKPAQYYVDSGIPTLRSANIREASITTTDLVYISENSNKLLSKSKLQQGYVVSVRTGYPGTSAVVPKAFDGANCVDLVISKPGSEILPEYLATWINSPFGKDQVLQNQGGLAQQHFNVSEMKKLLVLKPKIEEQKRILEVLLTHNALVAQENIRLTKLQRTKTGLMQDLLTGKVSVEPLLNDD